LATLVAPALAQAQYRSPGQRYQPSNQQRTSQQRSPQYVAHVNNQVPSRRAQGRIGKVLVIRGAFTVFSLGLDVFATKLRKQGCDVVVSTAATSSINANAIADEYRRNPNMGPIVMVGHSRGGVLAPELSRELGKQNVPVELIVIVDNTHDMSVPANVRRCVNFYHTNPLGVLHGLKAKGEGPPGQVQNINIADLPGRQGAGYIDHFNIEENSWVHNLMLQQVLSVCTPRYVGAEQVARQPLQMPQRTAARPIPQQQRATRRPERIRTAALPVNAMPKSRAVTPSLPVSQGPAARVGQVLDPNEPMFDYFDGVKVGEQWKR